MRPCPARPQARSPLPTLTTLIPRARTVPTLACVAGLVHMPSFMAGAITFGARQASTVSVSELSASPRAILASVLAVQGATTPFTQILTDLGREDILLIAGLPAEDPADISSVPGICIKCQACVRRCTKHAKYFDDPAFLSHVAMLEQNFAEAKENEFFI